jgi:hypothetical protein
MSKAIFRLSVSEPACLAKTHLPAMEAAWHGNRDQKVQPLGAG